MIQIVDNEVFKQKIRKQKNVFIKNEIPQSNAESLFLK